MIPPLVLALVLPVLPQAAPRSEPCATWQACRELALAAVEAGEFERFHDLAWRAAQRGPKNDPALLALVARAQSLSGRPHDAFVMLQRLATMGVAIDAAENPDFARVRALPGWADFAQRLAAGPREAGVAPAEPPPAGPGRALPSAPPVRALSALPAPAGRPGAGLPRPPSAKPAAVGRGEDVLRFTSAPFHPAGLAYDAVSSRFIVGNRDGHRVSVVGERSGRLVTLSGAGSGGFGQVDAIAIDVREGDLWVASSAGGDAPGATLHRLQLISGRVLASAAVPAPDGAARVTDLVVSERGDLVALDAASKRVLRLAPGTLELQVVAALDRDAVSVAPARTLLYLALADGVAVLDPGSGAVSPLRAQGNAALEGFEVLRWRRGALVGIQRVGGVRQVVRIVLDAAGRTALKAEVLDRPESIAPFPALALAGDTAYYLAEAPGPDGERQMVVRRVGLR